MTRAPADALAVEELAELFTAGYEGYVVPFRVDASQLASMIEAWDVGLARSRIALCDGEPVGVALLALRGE